MLEPDSRITYMELLRPPPGYSLVKAIGATYSADLETVLYAPLAMASKDGFRDKDGKPNPLAMLDSLRRNASKMVILCQRGRILLPYVPSRLNAFFNKVVFEVLQEKGAFHPKTWFLHFRSEDEGDSYRFICASRNLTFDRSWDAVLALDGKITDRENTGNRQLAEYLARLLDQGDFTHAPKKAELIEEFIAEMPYVEFSDTLPAEGISFDFSTPGRPIKLDWMDGADRALVISPFIQDEMLDSIAEKIKDGEDSRILISSQEALDRIDWSSLKERFKVYAWDDLSIMESSDIEGDEDGGELEERVFLSGLHAKLYVAEKRDKCVVVVGSANATNSGFRGINTELVALLEGRVNDLGIKHLLGKDETKKDIVRLSDFLREYIPGDKPVEVEDIRQTLARELENARRLLSECDFCIRVSEGEGEGKFDLAINVGNEPAELSVFSDTLRGMFWPSSLEQTVHKELADLLSGNEVVFANVDSTCLTKFISFRLSAEREGTSISAGFILCGRLIDDPPDLEERVLVSLVDSSDSFFQYLWFLLIDEYISLGPAPTTGWSFGHSHIADKYGFLSATPMFEDLLNKCVSDPTLVEDIDELISSFSEYGVEHNIIPQDFLSVWEIIRRGLIGESSGKRD